jgi:thiamine biosynthesis lipoprotein
MGTVISFDLRDADLAPSRCQEAIDEAVRWLHWVDATFSTYRADSTVARLARNELGVTEAEPEVRRVLQRCAELSRSTEGYFDAWSWGETLDPSGYVKGWAVEEASAILARAGSHHHCVGAGGDLRTRGCPGPDRQWQVGIAHPLVPGALTALLIVGEAAVATSGTSERGYHVIDPHTGEPATSLASVTIVQRGSLAAASGSADTDRLVPDQHVLPDLGTVDALATAGLARGIGAPAWLGQLAGYEALVIDALGNQWTTAGFDALRVPVDA